MLTEYDFSTAPAMSSLVAKPSLMDAAWTCATETAGLNARQKRQVMRAELGDQYPAALRGQLNDACNAARGLLAACYDIGDACHSEAIRRADAEQKLAKQFPGFSPETYSNAVSYGMFVSRQIPLTLQKR